MFLSWNSNSNGNKLIKKADGFGWGGVEGWGENADNCNWITIKIKKKADETFGEDGE